MIKWLKKAIADFVLIVDFRFHEKNDQYTCFVAYKTHPNSKTPLLIQNFSGLSLNEVTKIQDLIDSYQSKLDNFAIDLSTPKELE